MKIDLQIKNSICHLLEKHKQIANTNKEAQWQTSDCILVMKNDTVVVHSISWGALWPCGINGDSLACSQNIPLQQLSQNT